MATAYTSVRELAVWYEQVAKADTLLDPSYSARTISLFANPFRNRPWIVEAWAHGLGAGAHDVRGNDRQLVRAAIAGVQEDARMASRAVSLAALRETREHAPFRRVVPVDGNEERPLRAVGVDVGGAVAALAGRVQAEIPPAA